MEKKKRSKCPTSHRKVFTVNEANPKEKVIFDFLSTLYNESDIIKDILYEHIVSNNLQTAQQGVNIVTTLGKHSVNNNAVTCNTSVNNDVVKCEKTTYINEEKNSLADNFNIDLDKIEDCEIKMNCNNREEAEEANNNALNFIKNGF